MRLLADECVYRQVVARLRDDGHDVFWVKEECPGLDDEKVLAKAFHDNRLLLTQDYDFGVLTVQLNKPNCGVVILTVANYPLPMEQISQRAATALEEIGSDCRNALTIVEPSRIRHRQLGANDH